MSAATSSMRSMTGFGRAAVDDVVCEVRTLNQKGIDIKLRVPSTFEPRALALVKGSIERGRVDVTIETSAAPTNASRTAEVRALVENARSLASSLGIAGDLTAGDVMRALATSRTEAADVDAGVLERALVDALAACVKARDVEGAVLAGHIRERLDAIDALGQQLRTRAAGAPRRLADKLRARIDAAGVVVDAARFAQEAALLADRVDVTEELERLASHVSLGRTLTAGRKLDFLCQELLREANTIGSKCQDADAAHVVVELKAEIERMREQVQNVE